MLEFLFHKFAGLQAGNFIAKRLQHRCSLVHIVKFLRIFILKAIRDYWFWTLFSQSWSNNRKNRDVLRDDNLRHIQNPNMELFVEMVHCIYPLTFFAICFKLIVWQGYEHALIKLNKILVCCDLFHRKLGLQPRQIYL